ncbi:MAG: beta-ketoacyl-[acyl-carrier-protein] synthase II, partial [candidate division NC10 bacterium]|nr:beta-ketoacyl-[acyl-carrier-protein] synthase II [candidate division NC10 bacterium]
MRRVVVTGLGVVAPNGIGVDSFWENLVKGVSGVDSIARFDASHHDTKIAAEVKGFDPLLYMEKKEVKKMDRFIHYALAGAIMAADDAQLIVKDVGGSRSGVLIGTGMGGIPCLEETHKVLLEKGPGRISPFFIPSIITNLASGHIAIRFGLRGPNSCVSTACATGNHAIGDSFELIRRGMADVMFAGGTEAVISPLTIGGFGAMKALSTRNDAPQRASRPFDKGRDGFVMGEGAGVLILEELDHALRRDAK